MLYFGIVSAQDAPNCKVRVTLPGLDDMVTDLLPVMQSSTRTDKAYRLPDVGEHVVLLMDENAEAGVVLGAIYSAGDVPDSAATGVGVRALQVVKDGAAVFLATVKRATSGVFSLWSKTSVQVETERGDITITAGAKLKLRSTGKISVNTQTETLHGLLSDVVKFMQTHNHVATAQGTPTALLAPADIPMAAALVVRVNNFLEA